MITQPPPSRNQIRVGPARFPAILFGVLGVCWVLGCGGTPSVETARAAFKSGDYPTARQGFRGLAIAGVPEAQFRLGLMAEMGLGGEQNFPEARKWYELAAHQGHPRAQYHLGVLFDQGKAGDIDSTQAAKWFRKAAAQGDPRAQYNLGQMLATGDGIDQNLEEALRWLQAAADQDLGRAQFLLADLSLVGDDPGANVADALKWFRRAAEQGHSRALFRLGERYAHGMGLPVDSIEAYTCYLLALRNAADGEMSDRERMQANEALARLQAEMRQEELAEARKRAGAWQARSPGWASAFE
jgi:uncharacterized protein